MSKKAVGKRCIVIDASIARAAGAADTEHPVGRDCRQFLHDVRNVCHRAAWGGNLDREWDKHASTVAALWLASMNSIGKLVRLNDEPARELVELVEETVTDAGVRALLLKDLHLVTAAVNSDSLIASLDDTVRLHLSQQLRSRPDIMALIWVNPCRDEEQAAEWLSQGAKSERNRRLDQYEA